MKTINNKMKYVRWALGAIFLVLTIGALMGGDLFGILSVAPGLMLGMAAGAADVLEGETPTTDTGRAASTSLYLDNISKKITEIKPAATPLDTILRNIGMVVPVKAWKTDWYQVDTRGISDTLAQGFDTSASGTYDSTTGIHTLEVTNIHIWSVDDNILVQDVAGADGGDLIVNIVSKNTTAKTMGVIPVNGFGVDAKDLPDIPQGTTLIRIGNAKSELDAQTAPYTTYPQPDYNYCQIHMSQIEQSLYDKLHDKEVNWDITDFRAQSLYDLRRSMELTSLFGARGYVYDPEGNDYKYFSNGITRYITKSLGYTDGSLSNDQFMGWCEDIFVGNAGADQRIVFAGSDLLKQIMSVTFVQKQLESNKTQVLFGIKFNQIESNFGTLLWKHHNLLNDVGWSKKAIVLDINNIERHVFKPMQIEELLLKQSGQRNANAYRIDEAFCLATRYDDTHAIIAPTAVSGSGS